MKAIVTIGMSNGDEGKGATVDWLCRTNPIDLVIRYSGGSQCGHNVVTPEGQHHCFSQYGSGSFSNVPTHLDRHVIIDPLALKKERAHLVELGLKPKLSVHHNCLVTTPFHVIVNREKELARGQDKHGSCGQGIGETRHYWLKYGQDAIFAKDLIDHFVLVEKLELLRQRFLLENFSEQVYNIQPRQLAEDLYNDNLKLVRQTPSHEFAIFEAAQGVLLDENFGFQPHTTWSTVTDFHADVSAYGAVEKIGIIRAYHTRHGAGPLPSYDVGLTESIQHIHNPKNDWQDYFRCGWFDVSLFEYALKVNPVDSVAVTCLDHLPEKTYITKPYLSHLKNDTTKITKHLNLSGHQLSVPIEPANPLDYISSKIKVHSTSHGPTWKDRNLNA